MSPARLAAALAVVLVALAGCTSSAEQGRAGSSHRPNIVFVLTDDLSSDLLPYLPHVAALAQEGTSFANYFVVDSLCCPSRSAIFTGQYPHNDGVFTNHGADGGYAAFNRFGNAGRTYAVALQRTGYRTAMMGKYLNGYEPADGPQRGWDEWDVAGEGYAEYGYDLNQDGIDVAYGRDPSDYLTDVLATRAGHYLDQIAHAGRPFALEVATFAPHLPATPAPRDVGSFPGLPAPRGPAFDAVPSAALDWQRRLPPLSARDRRRIDRIYRKRVESAQAVDDLVGHLEARLRADGLAGDTYLVFSSDNGFHTGQHRLLPGKQTAFDTDIRVPLIVRGPGVPAGRTVPALASSVDLAPTFEQLGHAEPAVSSDAPDGVSLVPLLHGRPVSSDWQRAVLVEHHGPDFGPGDPDRQPIRAGNPPTYEAMRTPTATYVEYRNGDREYYDVADDPDELHNLASVLSPRRLAFLHRTLTALAHCRGAAACTAAAH